MVILKKGQRFTYPYTNIRTTGKSLEVAPIPNIVRIPLLSSKGLRGVCVVEQGQKVEEGDVIGRSGNFSFFASISGEVSFVGNQEIRVNMTQIVEAPVVEIRFGGKIKNWEKNPVDYLNRSSEELKTQILAFGVDHLNPTSCLSMEDILNFPKGSHLIVTGMEFSPMVTFLEELLLQHTERIHTALDILKYILQPQNTTIVVPNHLKHIYTHPHETVEYLDHTYPNGYEARLFHHFSNIDQYTKELLLEKQCVFIDLQTLFYIYNAVVLQKPFIDNLLTVEGKLVKHPAHYFVRIGAPIKTLIEDIGIYESPSKVLSGSIFLSDIIYNLESRYITPSIYSLFFLDEETYRYHRFEDCIQCGLCHVHCPVDLFPYDLASSSSEDNFEKCLNCGICSYVCPSRIALGYFLELRSKGESGG